MTTSIVVLVVLGLALVESSWGHVISVAGVHPDLVLAAVVSWTLLRGTGEGVVSAIAGGLCLGLFSSAPFGLVIVPLAIACLGARLGHSRVYGAHILLPLVLAFPLSLLYYLSYMLLLAFTGRPIAWDTTLVQVVLPASLLNVAAMLVVYPLMRHLHRRSRTKTLGW